MSVVRRKFVKRLNEWEVYISVKYPDKYFYYNPRTGETTWDHPDPTENDQITKDKDIRDTHTDVESPDKPYDGKSLKVSNDILAPNQRVNGPTIPRCINCAGKEGHKPVQGSYSESVACHNDSPRNSHHLEQRNSNEQRKSPASEGGRAESQGNGKINLKRSWVDSESSAVSYEDVRPNEQHTDSKNGGRTRASDEVSVVDTRHKTAKFSPDTAAEKADYAKRIPVAGIAEKRLIRLRKKLEQQQKNLLTGKNSNPSSTSPTKKGTTSQKNLVAHRLKVLEERVSQEQTRAKKNDKRSSNDKSNRSVCVVQDSKGIADEAEFLEAEEKMLMDVQELREEIHKAGGVSAEEIEEMICETIPSSFPDTKSNLYIVLDTNVLVSNFQSIEKLCGTNVEGIGCPVFIIPWMVLHELDILKDRRDVTKSNMTAVRAQKAISYLHSCFSSKHPRVIGQTLSDAGPNALRGLCNPDNSILECCIQQVKLGRRVLLLSDDKNLQNKCMINGIDAVGKSDLKNYLHTFNKPSNLSAKKAFNYDSEPNLFEEPKQKADILLANLRHCAKEVLSKVIIHEMKIAYGNKWLDIICVKPPFMLNDIFKCFTQHWFAVFGLVMSKNSLATVKELKNICDTHSKDYQGSGVPLNDVKNITIRFARLLTEIVKPDYDKLMMEAELYLEDVVTACENLFSPSVVKDSVSFSEPSSDWVVSKHIVVVEQIRKIWRACVDLCQQLRTFMARDQSSLDARTTILLSEDHLKTWVAHFYEPVVNLHLAMDRVSGLKGDPANLVEMNSLMDHIYKYFCELYKLISSGEQIGFGKDYLLSFCEDCDASDIFKEIKDQFHNFGVIMRQAIDYFSEKDRLTFSNNNVTNSNTLPNDVEMEESY